MAAVLICGRAARAQTPDEGFIDRVVAEQGNEHKYVVFVPKGDPPEAGWPVVLFLHGAGERGTDGRKQLAIGLGPAIRRRAETFPAVVVFPQTDFADGPILETWRADEPGGKLALAILADVQRQWPIDPSRRAVTGWSMGAYGALSLAAADPASWSKVLAVSGGGEPDWGAALARLPVWLVHGTRDRVVPVSESRELAKSIAQPHERLTLTEVPEAAHDLWRSAYDNDAVLDWLISKDVSPPPTDSVTAPADATDGAAVDEEAPPFRPALIISRALSLRLGNDALATLSAGAPQAMRDEGFQGPLAPISDEVGFDGRTFDVQFSEMTYSGQLEQVVLRGRGADRLEIAFALQEFAVRIGRIDVSDATDGVIAGPVSVIIGHREPVWMRLEVRPVAAEDGQLRLKLLRSRFAIPDFDWYVKPPETMTIRGKLFSEDVVRTAIVGGVYQRKRTIEESLLAAVPPMLRQVEQKVDFSPLTELIGALWPLPVYQPRLQVHLEETSTDREGISLVFGCAVAEQTDEEGEANSVSHVSASVPRAYELEPSRELQASVSLDVVEHLSAMMAGTNAVELFAADVPGRPFHELSDAQAVKSAIGDESPGRDVTDVRCQFALSEPFSIVPEEGPGDEDTLRLAVSVPRLSMTVFGKEDTNAVAADGETDGQWVPLAQRDLSIRQPLRLTTVEQLVGPTQLTVAWDADATVLDQTGADAAAGSLTGLFESGWRRWSQSQEQSPSQIPDVSVGASMLRLEQFSWSGSELAAEFLPAATVLANSSESPVPYCIREDHSRWSPPLTIGPHSRHVYRTGTVLQIRDAGRWSRDGQRMEPGWYDWSEEADADGFHWVCRPPSGPTVGESSPTTALAY